MSTAPQTIVDYAHPTMMAENALKRLHDAMLLKKYDEAIEAGLVAIAETRRKLNELHMVVLQHLFIRAMPSQVSPTARGQGHC
ncbi:hypothetical protein EBT31_21975 [bacterium]|nr:hypothetical protein [bacterium]